MGRFRAHIRRARRTLHEHLSVPALYFAWPLRDGVKPIHVRVHDKFGSVGDLKGTNFHYAEIEENSPRIIMMRSEVENPSRGMIISIGVTEAYRIDHVLPPDDITVTVKVSRLHSSEMAGMPTPYEDGSLPLFLTITASLPAIGA